jgi:hypothetical protein
MLHELQVWWQATSPQVQAFVREGGLVIIFLLAGYLLGNMVARSLRAMNFDALVRLTGSSETQHGFSIATLAGFLVRLTIWAAGLYWLAREHDKLDWAAAIGLIVSRTWALVTILAISLAVANLVASRFKELVQDTLVSDSRHRGAPGGLAGAIGAVSYGLVLLLALLVAADFFDWPLTRTSAQALWHLEQQLLTAGAALLIGCLGARFARDLVTPEATASPEKHIGQYAALALVTGSTVLAVTVLLSGAGLLLGMAALALLGFLLFLGRSYLPDLLAGLQLRGTREIWVDGVSWEVAKVGLLQTEVTRGSEFGSLPNREALQRTKMQTVAAPARR